MSASTGPREAQKKDSLVQYYLMGQVLINKGTQVVLQSDGYLYPLRTPSTVSASDIFVGIAYETLDNSAGTAGGTGIRVYKTGSHVMNMTSPVQANVGQALYGVDDQTVSTTSTNAVLVGYATNLDGSATIRMRIDRAVQ